MSGRAPDIGLALGALAALAAAAWLAPAGDAVALPGGEPVATTCWFRATTGARCPSCGMTRSFVALAHGDVGASMVWHPAGPAFAFAAGGLVVAVGALLMLRRRPLWRRRGFVLGLGLLAWIGLLAGLVRNVWGG